MLLTRKKLNTILANFIVSLPPEVKKELLDQYGHPATDDEGHVHEYTEQDICEGLRKRLYLYQSSQQQVLDKTVPITQ